MDQDVVGNVLFSTSPMTFDASQRNAIFAQDTAAFDHSSACNFQGGVNMLSAGFGFVHGFFLEVAGECVMQQRLLQGVQLHSLLLVDGSQAFRLFGEKVEFRNKSSLRIDFRDGEWG
jgi:hypothetical protein